MINFKSNIGYSLVLTTAKDVSFIKKISDYKRRLTCQSERMRMYGGGGFYIKRNGKIAIVPIKKVYLGHIIYISNGIYCVGEFIFITDKEHETLSNLTFKVEDKKIIGNQWRHFWSKDDILKEFVHPIDKLAQEHKELIDQLNSAKSKENYVLSRINVNELEQKKLAKSFGKVKI